MSLLHLYVDPDHDGGGDPEGDDAGDDGEVLVHHQVANLGVLPAHEEGKKRNLGTDRELEVKGEKYFLFSISGKPQFHFQHISNFLLADNAEKGRKLEGSAAFQLAK